MQNPIHMYIYFETKMFLDICYKYKSYSTNFHVVLLGAMHNIDIF